jgi:hypothetical protein
MTFVEALFLVERAEKLILESQKNIDNADHKYASVAAFFKILISEQMSQIGNEELIAKIEAEIRRKEYTKKLN